MIQVGDAVRLRDGSDLRDLLGDEWSDLTAIVGAVHEDGAHIALVFPPPMPGWTSLLPASEFVADRPLDASPF